LITGVISTPGHVHRPPFEVARGHEPRDTATALLRPQHDVEAHERQQFTDEPRDEATR
jgi:hypothetical protein